MVFLLVFFMRQKVQFQSIRVMTQAAIDHKGEDTLKAFAEFQKAAFPYERRMKMKEYVHQMDVLHRWVQGGAVGMTPQNLPRPGKPELARGAAALRNREEQKKAGLLQKM